MTDSLLVPDDIELVPKGPSHYEGVSGKSDDDGEPTTNGGSSIQNESMISKLQIELPGDIVSDDEVDNYDFVPAVEERPPEGKHSMWAAVANFINSIVGAGIIGLPFAMEEGGFGLSLLQLLFIGGLTAYSVQLIVELGNEMHVLEYEALCSSLLGTSGFYIASGSMIAFAYGAMISYLIIIGDTLSPIVNMDRVTVVLIFGIGICFPLSSFKDIGKLAKTSSISILGVLLLVSIVSIRGLSASSELGIRHDFQSTWLATTLSSISSDTEQDLVYCYSSCCTNMTYFPSNSSVLPQLGRSSLEPHKHRNIFVKSIKDFITHRHYRSKALHDPNQLQVVLSFTANRTDIDEEGELVWYTGTDKHQEKCNKEFTFIDSGEEVMSGRIPLAILFPKVENQFPNEDDNQIQKGVYSQKHPVLDVSWSHISDDIFTQFNITFIAPGNRMSYEGITFAHKRVFQSMGVISFAYVCHHSSFLVRNSLKDKTQWSTVVYISVGIATFLSVVMSCFGYWSFSRCTRPDILNNFLDSDVVINVARVTLAITMFFTFPMELFVVRQAVTSVAFKGNNKYHYPVTLVVFVASLIPGMLLSSDQLGLVLEFTGGVAASLLGFILPGVLWFAYSRWYKDHPLPPASQYVEYSSPHNRIPHCSNGAGLSLSTGGLPPPKQWIDIICSGDAVPPLLLITIGTLSLVANSILGVMHASGIGTYEYPNYCPDTGID